MIYKVLTVLDVPKGPSTASLEKKKIMLEDRYLRKQLVCSVA